MDVLSHVLKKKIAKLQILELKKNWNTTHLLKLVDKINPASIVEDTEQTRFGLQNGWTGGQTDGQNETSIHPLTSLAEV